jgi:hypothetical protein
MSKVWTVWSAQPGELFFPHTVCKTHAEADAVIRQAEDTDTYRHNYIVVPTADDDIYAGDPN